MQNTMYIRDMAVEEAAKGNFQFRFKDFILSRRNRNTSSPIKAASKSMIASNKKSTKIRIVNSVGKRSKGSNKYKGIVLKDFLESSTYTNTIQSRNLHRIVRDNLKSDYKLQNTMAKYVQYFTPEKSKLKQMNIQVCLEDASKSNNKMYKTCLLYTSDAADEREV
eukprot:TRINITY_DN9752_c0_g1_i2.p1 TRINITY_DN9752_c0_g1~~TRINITY_DN9752_c0_g1_i2.p1  ORF type:complete len:186 (+),score=27.25 TRINITY_DN9752_c0_g1_i2:65-559(+)